MNGHQQRKIKETVVHHLLEHYVAIKKNKMNLTTKEERAPGNTLRFKSKFQNCTRACIVGAMWCASQVLPSGSMPLFFQLPGTLAAEGSQWSFALEIALS